MDFLCASVQICMHIYDEMRHLASYLYVKMQSVCENNEVCLHTMKATCICYRKIGAPKQLSWKKVMVNLYIPKYGALELVFYEGCSPPPRHSAVKCPWNPIYWCLDAEVCYSL